MSFFIQETEQVRNRCHFIKLASMMKTIDACYRLLDDEDHQIIGNSLSVIKSVQCSIVKGKNCRKKKIEWDRHGEWVMKQQSCRKNWFIFSISTKWIKWITFYASIENNPYSSWTIYRDNFSIKWISIISNYRSSFSLNLNQWNFTDCQWLSCRDFHSVKSYCIENFSNFSLIEIVGKEKFHYIIQISRVDCRFFTN